MDSGFPVRKLDSQEYGSEYAVRKLDRMGTGLSMRSDILIGGGVRNLDLQ